MRAVREALLKSTVAALGRQRKDLARQIRNEIADMLDG